MDIVTHDERQLEFPVSDNSNSRSSNPIRQIEATSTDKMKGGAGHVILFDIQTGRFTGYGLASG